MVWDVRNELTKHTHVTVCKIMRMWCLTLQLYFCVFDSRIFPYVFIFAMCNNDPIWHRNHFDFDLCIHRYAAQVEEIFRNAPADPTGDFNTQM